MLHATAEAFSMLLWLAAIFVIAGLASGAF